MANANDMVYDPDTNTWKLPSLPVSEARQRQGQREKIANAAHGISTEARGHVRKIVDALSDMAATSGAHGVIRGTAKSGGDGRKNAQAMLDAQRSIVSQAQTDAKAALSDLRPALLAAVISAPDGATETQIADKKADLIAALEAVGKSGANFRAQALLSQAMASGDRLMAYVICSPDVMGYRAEALGYRLDTLQQKYAAAQLAKVGLHPLDASAAVPGVQLINLLPEISQAISGHSAGATAELNQLAAECGLR